MKLKCVYMRGGTSKAVFFHEKDLPEDRTLWPEIFLKVMGTPDPKQIDGMGGAAQITSKIAVIAPSQDPSYDIDYTFFQIGVDAPVVDDRVNCGNISCGVGPFAVDEGLVPAKEPVTVVRVKNTNTGKFIEEHVPVKDGKAMTTGDARITGVPGTGAGMDVYFEHPGGATTGKLFPTGNVRDILYPTGYAPIEATLIDCSNPVTILRAADLGLNGGEITPFQQDQELLRHIEAIRCQAAVLYGFVDKAEDATEKSLARPKIAVVSQAHDFMGSNGVVISGTEMDICSRVVSVGAFHKTHPITSGIALAAAANICGTLAQEAVGTEWDGHTLRVGHPYGVLPIKIVMDGNDVLKAGTVRTARRIMDGYVYIND
ncbi:MAG: 3-methylitaconate isomerase [Stomatobaculum sp.]|nr:3-methylitaconate isomerase [Stomatobaculum sp.]